MAWVGLYALYLVIAVVVFITLIREDRPPKNGRLPFVSVVIAVRNEEETIRACLASLAGQPLPPENYEVIVVDDHSDDDTPRLAKEAIAALENFRYVRLPEGRAGKKQAMILGIAEARGECIALTDADCTVHPEWLSELCSHLKPPQAMVGGFTLVRYRRRLIERIQALEYDYMLAVGTSISRLFGAVSLFGNNLAFAKDAYAEAGGFERVRGTVQEDFRLVRSFSRRRVGRIRLIFNGKAIVTTEPMRRWPAYFEQRKRWSRGILNGLPGWKILLAPLFLAYVGASVFPFFTGYALPILGLRLLADLLIVLRPVIRYRQFGLIPCLILFEMNLVLTVFTLGLRLVFSRQMTWKGRPVD